MGDWRVFVGEGDEGEFRAEGEIPSPQPCRHFVVTSPPPPTPRPAPRREPPSHVLPPASLFAFKFLLQIRISLGLRSCARNKMLSFTSRRAFSAAAAAAAATSSSVGFIGLGNMGAHMARNLLKNDHEVVVFDISADAVSQLESAGARSGKTPAEGKFRKTARLTDDTPLLCSRSRRCAPHPPPLFLRLGQSPPSAALSSQCSRPTLT